MKGNLRYITIYNQTWKWVVESRPKLRYSLKEVRIYSPDKKMYRVHPDDIYTTDYEGYEDYNNELGITPQMIRIYIKKNLINNTESKS